MRRGADRKRESFSSSYHREGGWKEPLPWRREAGIGAGILGIARITGTAGEAGAAGDAGAIMAAGLRGRAHAPPLPWAPRGARSGSGATAGTGAAPPVPPLPTGKPGQPGTPSRCSRVGRGRCGRRGQEFPGSGGETARVLPGLGRSWQVTGRGGRVTIAVTVLLLKYINVNTGSSASKWARNSSGGGRAQSVSLEIFQTCSEEFLCHLFQVTLPWSPPGWIR